MSGIVDTWLAFAPPPDELKDGQKWNVFLSYRSVNRPWVINLYDVLRGHGHKVFLDQVTIVPGDRLIGTLEDALETSQAGVLVWSTTTADSEWVRREYEVMEAHSEGAGFHFVPVRLDTAKLPPFARTRVFLDFSGYPDGPNGGELLRLLHAIVGKPLTPEAARFAVEQDTAAQQANASIKAMVRNGNAPELLRLFERGGPAWETSSALACATAEGLTKLKSYDATLSLLDQIEPRFPNAIRPKQLRALALARRGREGDLDVAQNILGVLYELGERDPETLGIYGRTWMDRYEVTKNVLHLRKSRDLYAEAFSGARDDYYTGINAAAKSILIGTPTDVQQGQTIAQRVQALVGLSTVPGDYWRTATVGEVQLMLGNYAAAGARYGDAVAIAPNELGSHETTWKQACRLMTAMQPTAEQRAVVRSAFAHLPDCP